MLLNRQQSLYEHQKRVLAETYKEDNSTNAINQVFLGTVMSTLAVERQTVNATQLRYGCEIPMFKSNVE